MVPYQSRSEIESERRDGADPRGHAMFLVGFANSVDYGAARINAPQDCKRRKFLDGKADTNGQRFPFQ
jgi:hypothetical protein